MTKILRINFLFFVRVGLCLLMLAAITPTVQVISGTWRVIPIRLEFDQRARSGVISVINDSDDKISFSITASEWTQDKNGKDQYTNTSDLMFFPKALHIDPHSERVIRAGTKFPALKTEKTYRLFIKQELPPEQRSGTNVAIAIRFGVPIFSKPIEEHINGEITQATITAGVLKLSLKNHGNTHILARTLRLSGQNAAGTETLTQEQTGGYLLAGSERSFDVTIPAESCADLSSLDIQVISNIPQLNETIAVDRAMCLSP